MYPSLSSGVDFGNTFLLSDLPGFMPDLGVEEVRSNSETGDDREAVCASFSLFLPKNGDSMRHILS